MARPLRFPELLHFRAAEGSRATLETWAKKGETWQDVLRRLIERAKEAPELRV
jgi:hypothetical protein